MSKLKSAYIIFQKYLGKRKQLRIAKKEKLQFEKIFPQLYNDNQKFNNSISMSYSEAVDFITQYKVDETCIAKQIIDPPINNLYDLDIIIPMYNGMANNGIDETLSSILMQKTEFRYRVLVMNDGSTDDSYEYIKQKYAYPNIFVYTQQNAGQGVAKNRLLDISDSKYVMFIDCCDILISENAIQTLMTLIIQKNADMVCGNYINFINKDTLDYSCLKKLNTKKVKDISSQRQKLTVSSFAGAKLFKREIWNGMRYIEHCCFDDAIIKFVSKRKTGPAYYINIVTNGYKVNLNSLTKKKSYNRLDTIWALQKSIDIAHSLNIEDDIVLLELVINHIVFTNSQHIDQDDIFDANIVIGKKILEQLNMPQSIIDELHKYSKYLYQAIMDLNVKNIKLIQENTFKHNLYE